MDTSTVTSKGQVTIPSEIRRALGIRQGSRVVFSTKNGQVALRVTHAAPEAIQSGFGMLAGRGKHLAPDFDPASLLAPKPTPRASAKRGKRR